MPLASTRTEPPRTADLAREDFARLLCAGFYQPEGLFAEERVFERLAEAAALFSPELEKLARPLAGEFSAVPLSELLLDYSRLFLGPFDILARPYGSVYLDGEKVVMGPSTAALQELFNQGGFTLAEDFRELPDHVAAELEFLYRLIFQENEARATGDTEALGRTLALKESLLRDHLGAWIAPFASAIRSGAATLFYRRLADLTEAFLSRERALLSGDEPD